MKPKERVLTALSHRNPDRVPIDYWATAEVDDALCRHFRAENKEELLLKLGSDLRYVFPTYIGPKLKQYSDGSREDIWGVRRKKVRAVYGTYDHVVFNPLARFDSPKQLDSWPLPSPDWYDYSSLSELCRLYEDYALVTVGDRVNRTSVLHAGIYLRGLSQILVDLVKNPRFAERLFERVNDFYLEVNRRIFQEVGGKLDIFMMGDDMGTQTGLLVSPQTFREMIAPHLKKHVDLAKQYGLKVMLHSCGAIRKIIPDLIEMGIDILNPIQVRASGMNPSELKKSFGDQLCFHGSVDIQKTMPMGTVDDVRTEVRDRIRTLGEGGGFILCTTHNIQSDVPLENILAMYDEASRPYAHVFN